MSNLRTLWTMGITMSGTQQQNLFLKPLEEPTKGLVGSLETIASAFTPGGMGTDQSSQSAQSIIIRVLSGLAGLTVLISVIAWSFRRHVGTLGRLGKSKQARRQTNAPPIPFYERFLAILARKGHQRSDSQTPREFARSLHQQLQSNGTTQLPEALTTAFYQVRFGQQTLPPAQLDALNASLDQFERSLQNGTSST